MPDFKRLIPFINGENEIASNIVKQAENYCFAGADAIFIYNYSKIEKEREEFTRLKVIKTQKKK